MHTRKLLASVFTPLPDGSGVLLNLETLLYFSLNRTGAVLWQEIDRVGTADLEYLVNHACERFEVDQTSAQGQITDFVEHLARLGFLNTSLPTT